MYLHGAKQKVIKIAITIKIAVVSAYRRAYTYSYIYVQYTIPTCEN